MRGHAESATRGLLASSALALVALLALSATPALARQTHQLSATFGASGSGAGQLQLQAPNLEAEPKVAGSGLAVNQATHDVYVADTANHRVAQFTSSGSFVRAFGADVGGLGIDVCTSTCQAGAAGSAPGAFQAPTFIAIDDSPGGEGDVYVADTAAKTITKFDSEGALAAGWGTGGQITGTGSEAFLELAGIAVDSAGNLDVLQVDGEPHLLLRFAADGSFSGTTEIPRGNAPGGLAIDPGGSFFKLNGTPTAEKFTGTGTDVGQVNTAESGRSIAVDAASGALYVNNQGNSVEAFSFGPSGEVIGSGGCAPASFAGCPPTDTFGVGDLSSGAGLAVDGDSHTVYAADAATSQIKAFAPVTFADAATEAAAPVSKDSATLHGTVSADGGPEAGCEFQLATEAAFQAEGFQGATSLPCSPPGPFTGSGDEAVSADATGLATGTTYRFRVVASNEDHVTPGATLGFQTLGPVISESSASEVSETTAKVSGQIDPEGSATSFQVQYVGEAEFLQSGYANAVALPVPAEPIGSGSTAVPVSQVLTGLDPGTAYHFRLTATSGCESGGCTSFGPDGTFTTFPVTAAGLPDGRAYEMVSPSVKKGEVFPPEPTGTLGGSCNVCLPGQQYRGIPMQASPSGDVIAYAGQPFFAGLSSSVNQYLASRSSMGWTTQGLSPVQFSSSSGSGYEAMSPDLSQAIIYQTSPSLSPDAPTAANGKSYPNLYLRSTNGSIVPIVSQEPPTRRPGEPGNLFEIEFSGANPGSSEFPPFQHIIFEANDALTPALEGIAPAAPSIEPHERNLYEWSDGRLGLVNVLPGNTEPAPGATIGSGHLLTPKVNEAPAIDHAISADGRKIFWSDANGQVFVRVGGVETQEIHDGGKYVTASRDGSKVLLTDGCLYDLEAQECEVEITQGAGEIRGVLGYADDLSVIYFVSSQVLTGVSENARGEQAEPSAANLYVWKAGGPVFIGRLMERGTFLSSGDNETSTNDVISSGDWKPSLANRTAQVTSSGRYLSFMSEAPLTGYDNEAASGPCPMSGGPRCFEVFVFDSKLEELSCASCNPSGEPPLGYSNLSLIRPSPSLSPYRQPQNLSPEGNGRVFFESQDVLSPRDQNGHIQDVYEWEPGGVGNCAKADGCVSLISSGQSPNDSMFVDSSASGNDAFFITRQQLVPRDKDEQLDLYDARVGGGFPEEVTPPCGGEACKGASTSPPGESQPGSATFSGPPNKKYCKKGFVKKHGKCVKKKSKKHRKHKRSAKNNHGGSK